MTRSIHKIRSDYSSVVLAVNFINRVIALWASGYWPLTWIGNPELGATYSQFVIMLFRVKASISRKKLELKKMIQFKEGQKCMWLTKLFVLCWDGNRQYTARKYK